jgi:cytoskeletal protein CcmA (bactofilin family)
MFGKKKNIKQSQSIPENTKESKLIDNSKIGFEKKEKENESRKGIKMAEGKVTNLTSDVEIKGTIKFGEVMRIDGKFDGDLISDNGELVIGKTGNVKANVKVRSAVIEGRVDGNIKASDKVELKQKAQLIGDLQAKTLVIEEGVVFVGQCNVNPEGTKIESQSYKEGTKEEVKDKVRLNV